MNRTNEESDDYFQNKTKKNKQFFKKWYLYRDMIKLEGKAMMAAYLRDNTTTNWVNKYSRKASIFHDGGAEDSVAGGSHPSKQLSKHYIH